MREPRGSRSNPEYLGVVRLDFFAVLLHRGRILLHQLDVAQWSASRLVLDLRMKRTHAALIDQEFLAFGAEAEALEQPCGIGIGRRLEQGARRHDQWSSLG